jgi:hypothetical protein
VITISAALIALLVLSTLAVGGLAVLPHLAALLALLTWGRRASAVLVRHRCASTLPIRLLALLSRHAGLGALFRVFAFVLVGHFRSPSAARMSALGKRPVVTIYPAAQKIPPPKRSPPSIPLACWSLLS